MIRVRLSRGGVCRTFLLANAGDLLLPTKNLVIRGLIERLPTANSRMSDSVSDSRRFLGNCRRVPATAFRWSAKTGRTRRRRIGSSITIESAKRRSLAVTFEQRAIALRRRMERSWCCMTPRSLLTSEKISMRLARRASISLAVVQTDGRGTTPGAGF